MKPLEIKGARTRLGYTQQYMADRLDISLDTYRKKEKGVIKFADTEKVTVAKAAGADRPAGERLFFRRAVTDW